MKHKIPKLMGYKDSSAKKEIQSNTYLHSKRRKILSQPDLTPQGTRKIRQTKLNIIIRKEII